MLGAVKIGRPGYRVTKQFDADTHARSLLFQVVPCAGSAEKHAGYPAWLSTSAAAAYTFAAPSSA